MSGNSPKAGEAGKNLKNIASKMSSLD